MKSKLILIPLNLCITSLYSQNNFKKRFRGLWQNCNGKKVYITGKRFLAHHGRDAGDADAAILLYFEFNTKKAPYFTEQIIDYDSGVGLNITVKDMNKD